MRSFIKRMTPERLKELYRKLRGKVLGFCFGLFGHFPIRSGRVVCENVWGYGDNPKSVALALRKLDKSLEIIFVAGGKKRSTAPKGIKLVAAGSIRAVFYLATARVWVDCNHKPYYVRKRPGQFYMQTWHGSLPLKRIEADAEGLSEEYLKEAAHVTGLTDVFLSNSEFCSDIYRHAFGYRGRIALTGSPRLDNLLRCTAAAGHKARSDEKKTAKSSGKKAGYGVSRRDKILGRLGISGEKGIVLYAPTFRGGGEDAGPLGAFDPKAVCSALKEKFGKEFTVLAKLHPLAVSHGCSVGKGLSVIDASTYPNIYEILEAADVLITDYSNVMFEFSYTGKPCYLFAPDSDRYKSERGMYFVYDMLPFPIAATGEELCARIKNCDVGMYAARAQAFYRDLGVREDGHASKRAARILLHEIYKNG